MRTYCKYFTVSVSTVAVRTVLAYRHRTVGKRQISTGDLKQRARAEAIEQFVSGVYATVRLLAIVVDRLCILLLSQSIPLQSEQNGVDPDRLLQEIDIQRLKGVVYRDMVIKKREKIFPKHYK